MAVFSKFISWVCHPVFMIAYMLFILLYANPYSFGFVVAQDRDMILIYVFVLSVFFPLVAIAIMKGVGLIDSIHLRTAKERIGPLIATGIFYLWLFVNIKNNSGVAPMFSSYVLGAILGVFAAISLNAFLKISLHAIGIAGIWMASLLFVSAHSYPHFHTQVWNSIVVVDTTLIFVVLTLCMGLVGASRLILNAHTSRELLGGYVVGIVSQLLAYSAYMNCF